MIRTGTTPSGIAVIGAPGSVGGAVLDVCRSFPDRFHVSALSGLSNVSRMTALVKEFSPELVSMCDPEAAASLKRLVPPGTKVLSGIDSLTDVALFPGTDQVVFASSGTAAIPALMSALEAGRSVSLANKESLVIAGPWVMPLVRSKDQMRPLDSEHNAVWQCLSGETDRSIQSILLTASGGPFRAMGTRELERVTPRMALKHPVWAMGAKITVDSATLMNKGLEILEAMQLFRLPAGKVRAIVHPQSLVHGMVLFSDCTMKWLLSSPDMRIPAAVALAYPERLQIEDAALVFPPLETLSLSFEEPDLKRFPCLSIAMEAARTGGATPALLVGADDVAVKAFLDGRLSFTAIPGLIEQVLTSYPGPSPTSAEEAIAIMEWSKRKALEILCPGKPSRRSIS